MFDALSPLGERHQRELGQTASGNEGFPEAHLIARDMPILCSWGLQQRAQIEITLSDACQLST